MDIVGLWLEDNTARNPDSALPTSVLYDYYKRWAETQIGFSISTIAFARDLSRRGFKPTKVGGHRGFRGLKLVSPPQ